MMLRSTWVWGTAWAVFATGAAFAAPEFCAVDYFGRFSHIDAESANVTLIRQDLPRGMQALAWSPNGVLYAGRWSGSANQLYKIDPWTGDTTYIRDLSLGSDVTICGMAISADNSLYVGGRWNLQVVDLETGTVEATHSLHGDTGTFQGLTFAPGGRLYGIAPFGPTEYRLFTIDADGTTHLIGQHTGLCSQSLEFTEDGRLFALGGTRPSAFAELPLLDGSVVGTPLTISGDYRGLALVPEPAGLSAAAAALALAIRRRSGPGR